MRIKRSLCLLLALLAALPLTVWAEPEEENEEINQKESGEPAPLVLDGADRDFFFRESETAIDCFNSPVIEWRAETADTGVEAAESLPGQPGTVWEGSRALLLSGKGTAAVSRSFGGETGQRADLSDGKWLVFSAALTGELSSGRTAELGITLLSGMRSAEGEVLSFSASAVIAAGKWQTVFIDLTGFEGRGDIRKITFSAAAGGEISAAIDALCFSRDGSLPDAVRYLSASYRGSHCRVTYFSDRMTVTMNGADPAIEADDLAGIGFPGQSGIRVRFANYTGCKNLILYYTTPEEPDYSEKRSVTVGISGSSVSHESCVFPIPAETVSAVKLVFSGNLSGEAEFFEIVPVSFPLPEGKEYGRLTSCLIAATRDRVTVTGELTEAALQRYGSGSLRLYALPLYADESALTASSRYLAEAKPSAAFSFSAVLAGGDYSCLTMKYTAAIVQGGTLIPIGDFLSVTNPEILSDSFLTAPGSGEKKGVNEAVPFDDTDGVRHVSVRIGLETLLSLGEEGIAHVTDGKIWYFREDAVKALDEKLSSFASRGAAVTAVLTVSRSEDAALNRVLLHPSASPDAEYSAFNTVTGEGAEALRAVTDFLADRYSAGKGLTGTSVICYTVGIAADRTASCFGMGEVTLAEAAKTYADAVRIVYNTVKARSSGASVCLSLDCDWNRGLTVHAAGVFDSRSMLEAVNAVLAEGGNIDWRLAFDPYPYRSDYLAYADGEAGTDENAPCVTLKNIEVLTALLTKRTFYYGEGYRSVILLESFLPRLPRPVDGNLYIRKSADFVFGFYKISMPNASLITALIPAHSTDHADTLRWVDAAGASSRLSYAEETIGIAGADGWKTLIPAFDLSRAAVRECAGSVLTHTEPSTVVGSYSFLSFPAAGGTEGWYAEGCRELTAGVSYLGKYDLLSAVSEDGRFLIRYAPGKKNDFSVSPYLCMEVCLTGLTTANAAEKNVTVPVSVTVRAAGGCAEAVGEVTVGEWTKLIVDLHGFSGIRSVESIALTVSGKEEATLLVGQVRLLSDEYSGADLEHVYSDPGETGGDAEQPDRRVSLLSVAVPAAVILLSLAALVFRAVKRGRGRG